jgi:hypothetical protein
VIDAELARTYTHTFSNGAQIELIGLSRNPSRDEPWWRPDGSPLDERPYDDVRARMGDSFAREVCFRWKNLPEDGDYTIHWMTEPHYSSAGGTPYSADGERIENLSGSAFAFGQNLDTCTLRFTCSVENTPWKTKFRNAAGGGYASIGSFDGSAIFGPINKEDGGTSAVVSFQVPGGSVRLVGIDHQDEPHVADATTGAGTGNFNMMTYHFAGIAPDQFKRFELQTQQRRLEMVAFRNVSLHSGKLTNVEAVPIVEELRPSPPTLPPTPAAPPALPAVPATPATPAPPAIIDELGMGPYPMRNDMSAEPAEDWQEKRQLLYSRVNELAEQLAADPRGQLGDGEVLKFLPAEIDLPAVHELRRLHATDERPTWMILHASDDGLSFRGSKFGSVTVAEVLDRILGIKLHRIDTAVDLLDHEINGDWIMARNLTDGRVTDVEEIAAFENVLREQLDLPVRLKLVTIDRPVYVARGTFKDLPESEPNDAQPGGAGSVPHINMPARRALYTASVAQDFAEFLEMVGEVLLTPIIDELDEPSTAKAYFVGFDRVRSAELLDPLDAATEARVIAELADQTGLSFTLETRPVEMLVITSSP